MPTLEALFAEICAHPTDMEPRREYAKLVGGERGAFILEQLDGSVDEAKYLRPGTPDYQVRMKAWSAPLVPETTHAAFCRGFVECVEIDATWFIDNYQRLFATAPVRQLSLTGTANASTCRRLFACPGLAQISALFFLGNPHPTLLESAIHCVYSHQVKYFMIERDDFSDPTLKEFLQTWKQLECFSSPNLKVTAQRDWNGAILDTIKTQRLTNFELVNGHFPQLHCIDVNPDNY